MHRLLRFLPVFLLVNCFPSPPVHAQIYWYPPGYYRPGYYPPGYYRPGYYPPGPPPPPVYQSRPGPYAGGPAYSPENCGTPDEPKPCPPMPRVPLPYYPPNR